MNTDTVPIPIIAGSQTKQYTTRDEQIPAYYLVMLAMMILVSVLFSSSSFLLRPSFSPTMLGLNLLIVVAQFESLHRLHRALSSATEIGVGVDPA